MDTSQFKKFGAIILGLGILAILLYFVYSGEALHLYIGIGAAAIGAVLLVMGVMKK